MNYDVIAALNVNGLRKEVRRILPGYNELTGQTITAKVIGFAPKSRLLYILCRFMAEVDAHTKYEPMMAELEQREANVATAIEKSINPPVRIPTGKQKQWRIKGTFDWRHTNNVDITIEEVNDEDN
jgi:hypothetical protein